MAFDLYDDPALAGADGYIQRPDGNKLRDSDIPFDKVKYLGSPLANEVLKEASDPGVDTIKIKIGHVIAEWSASQAVATNDQRRSATHNGYVYQAQGPGATGLVEPTWPTTLGATISDGTVTWQCLRRTAEPEHIALASSQSGLDSATPGATLDLGVTQVDGGAGNAVEVHARVLSLPALLNIDADLYIGNDDWLTEAA